MKYLFHKIKRSVNKLSAIKDEPLRIANGYALGIFLATTPLIGLKVFIALIVSSIFKWNKAAAVIGVYHVNSLTAPLFYGFTFIVGKIIIGGPQSFQMPDSFTFSSMIQTFGNIEILMILVVGGLAVGIPATYLARKLIKKILDKGNGLNTDNSSFALVTGASRGLGKEIARELARRGYNLLLVSLKNDGLNDVCLEISNQFGVEVNYLEANLSESHSVYEVAEWALSKGRISILVNNAGIGGTEAFEEVSTEYIDTIIQLNIRATSLLTHLMLPELKRQKQAYVLNVSSMASFSPIAYKTVYPASKTFVWSFSRGLNEELKKTSVFVSVIHPGPMKTNPDVTKRIEKQGFFGRIGLVSPGKMGYIAVNQMLKRDSLIIPGFLNKINWLLIHLIPIWIRLNLLSNVIKRELKEEQYARIKY